VTKQTAQTHGQFAKQSGTAAEKSQQLGAWFDNLKAKIGAGLLPVFSTLATFFEQKIGPALDMIFRKGGPLSTMFAQVGAFITIVDTIAWILDKAADVIGFIGKVGSFIFGGSGSGGGGGAPRGAAPLRGATRGASGVLRAAGSLGSGGGVGPTAAAAAGLGGTTINITVTGALDPAAVADQIAALLDKRARRIGLAVAGARA
jgi:hypothetical protein